MNSSLSAASNALKNKSIFRGLYIVTTFFFSVNFAQFLSYGIIVLLFLWGTGLIIYEIKMKNIRKVCLWQYFTGFLVLGLISNVISIICGYASILGIVIGILMLIVTAQFIFLFFGAQNEDISKIKKELYIVAKIIFYIITICNLIGLLMLLVFHHQIILGGQKFIIYENRFIGVYTNPNMAGYDCFFCIICGLILRNKSFAESINKRRMKRRILFPALVIAYVTLVLTASRGAFLIIVAFLVAISCFLVYRAVRTHTLRQTVVKIICFVLIICAMPLFSNLCSSITSKMISGNALIEIQSIDPTDEEAEVELHTEDGMITFEHITGEADGSGRLTLYQKSINLFLQKPIFGWGNGNVLLMGNEIKETVNTLLVSFGNAIFEAHNGYLTILSTGGIFSFLIFAFCGINIIWTIGQNARASIKKGKKSISITIFSFLGSYCAYAMVEPSIVYYPSFVVATLWFMLGLGFAIARDEEGIDVYNPDIKMFKRNKTSIVETDITNTK